MKFEFYVLNYDVNKGKVIRYNIFNNRCVQETCEKEVKKYLRSPKKYQSSNHDEVPIYGFDGFCNQVRLIILWQEWARREYEISVGDAFEEDVYKLEKVDCFYQCELNIPVIAREIIYQYKEQLKKSKSEVHETEVENK